MTAYFNWFISFAFDFTCLLICVGKVSLVCRYLYYDYIYRSE